MSQTKAVNSVKAATRYQFGLDWMLSLIVWCAILFALLRPNWWLESNPFRTLLQTALVLLPSGYISLRYAINRQSVKSLNLTFGGVCVGFLLPPVMYESWTLGNVWIGSLGLVGPHGVSVNAVSIVFFTCVGAGAGMTIDFLCWQSSDELKRYKAALQRIRR